MCTQIVSLLNMEQLLTCPYEPAHRIRRYKMCVHINKCRKNYEKNNPNQEMSSCPYNSNHVVPEMELEYHMEECEDRIKGDAIRCSFQREPESVAENSVAIKLNEIPDVECDDDWNIPTTVGSVNANIQASLKERKVIIPRQGATKSERKAHYMEERIRHNGFEDVKLKQPSTSHAPTSLDNNQRLRKPRTASTLSAASSSAPTQQEPPSLIAKPTEKPRAASKSLTPVKENIKPQQIFPKGRGRAPGDNIATAPQPVPKVGRQVPGNSRAVDPQPEPGVKEVSLNLAQANIDPLRFGGIDEDGFITIPIPNKGRGRKLNPPV